MAIELRPKTKKLNYNKSGAAKAHKECKRKEAEERQAAYAKIPFDQKLAKAGPKERAKLLARKDAQK